MTMGTMTPTRLSARKNVRSVEASGGELRGVVQPSEAGRAAYRVRIWVRDEGLAYADSPTNLMWRLQNDMTPVSRIVQKKEEESDQPSFTEITIDVRPEEVVNISPNVRRF